MKFARVLILAITLSFGACTGLDDGVHFIEDYKSSYILVEGCSPTAHPVGGYVEIWVSPDAASNADVKDLMSEQDLLLNKTHCYEMADGILMLKVRSYGKEEFGIIQGFSQPI